MKRIWEKVERKSEKIEILTIRDHDSLRVKTFLLFMLWENKRKKKLSLRNVVKNSPKIQNSSM